jgi:hypothetical protein
VNLPRFSSRDRRALLLGAAVLASGVCWTAIVRPYFQALQGVSSALTAERDLLDRELRLLAGADQYAAEFEQAGARLLDVATRLFGGENNAVASAGLIRYLQEGAGTGPALLTRLEPLPAEEEGNGLVGLPLRVEGETDLEGLLTVLHLLDAGSKLVRVENLRVQGRRAVAVDGPEVLSFEFVARGFSLAESESQDAGGSTETVGGSQ